MLLDNVITIDPGKNTGWAYWAKGDLIDSGTDKTTKDDVSQLISVLAIHFRSTIEGVSKVYIESVGLWGNTERSQISAAKGNTFLVAYIIGAYIHECNRYYIPVELIDPRKWKGNMNKAITSRRVEKALGYKVKNEHECDAIGIGLSLMGKL